TLMTRWRIELFGGLRLFRDGQEAALPGRKSAALLACLAFYLNRQHAREALAEQLWSDEPLDATRDRFKQALSVLRRSLEPEDIPPGSVLAANRTHVRLQP